MATDVARLSFDPARLYRGVVPQQGRVSLEAEANEQRTIDTEEQRAEVIDIVGPVGTPDDGYAVSAGTGFELTIGPGTMYVGGWRVELGEKMGDYHQPDWLDRGRGWRETGREHVLLKVIETDVTAVEDPALYEVALGGPDGAARTRLLQRVERHETDGTTCAAAIAEDIKRWLQEGLRYDPATAALLSRSRLLVTWEADPAPPDPCEPTSTGGYLGAENQLLRVQLTRLGQNGRFDIVWGYDDASFLYRVTADTSTNPVLTLDRSPVDDFHRPRAGQAVQVLRATAELERAPTHRSRDTSPPSRVRWACSPPRTTRTSRPSRSRLLFRPRTPTPTRRPSSTCAYGRSRSRMPRSASPSRSAPRACR